MRAPAAGTSTAAMISSDASAVRNRSTEKLARQPPSAGRTSRLAVPAARQPQPVPPADRRRGRRARGCLPGCPSCARRDRPPWRTPPPADARRRIPASEPATWSCVVSDPIADRAVAPLRDALQLRHPSDVDQGGRFGQPQLQRRQQAVSTGQEPAIRDARQAPPAPRRHLSTRTIVEKGAGYISAAPAIADAAWTAATMLAYPVQRHRLPLRPSRICASVGLGSRCSRATGGQHHAGGAVAALHAVMVPQLLLHRVQGAILREAFDGGNRAAVDLRRQQRARLGQRRRRPARCRRRTGWSRSQRGFR